MEKDLIYPKVETIKEFSIPFSGAKPSAPLLEDRQFNDILDREKMKFISEKINGIEKELKHYSKLRKRWKNFLTISKFSFFGFFVISEIGTGLIVFIPVVGQFAPLIIPGVGLFEMLISAGLLKIIDKRKKNMDNKIIKCRSTLDKLFLFLQKALKDKIIDEFEMEIFNKIINDYNSDKEDEVKIDNNKEELDQRSDEIENFKKNLKDQIDMFLKKK